MAIAQAYDFAGATVSGSPATGAGTTVGLLEFDSYYPSDVTSWVKLFGLDPNLANHVTEVNVDGGTTPNPSVGETEVMLDIEAVLGMAQGANIVVYDAPNVSLGNGGAPIASWQDLFNKMIDNNVDVISSSWGDCEWQHPKADALSLDSILASAAASGISTFQAIGDHGANCNNSGHIDPGFPDEDPNTTGVGGTSLQVTSTGAYQSEGWWDYGSDSAGRGGFGISCCFTNPTFGFPRPAYENGFTTAANRSVPDVSADADPNSGIIICQADQGGCTQQYGGTSLAAPEWAAGMAIIDQALGHRTGNLNPALYAVSKSSGFHSPSGMQPSESGATNDFAHLGLGSFDLGNLAQVLSPVAPAITGVTPSSGPLSGGTVVTISGKNFGASGTTVSFGSTAATNVVCTASQCTATSPAQTTSGVVDVRVTLNGQTSPIVAADRFTYFGAVSAASSTVVALPATLTADGATKATVTVTLLDGNGTPVSGKSVSLSKGSGLSMISAASGASSADGVVTFTVTSTTAETDTYTATDVTDNNLPLTQTAPVTFTPGPASGTTSTVSASPASEPADGSSSAAITVTLFDANHNPINGKTITLTQGSGHSLLPSTSAVTNSSGFASFSATDSTVEPVTYTATDTSDGVAIAQMAQVNFVQPQPSVAIKPDIVFAAPGQSVSVALQAQAPSSGLGSWDVHVTYDASALTVSGCTLDVSTTCDTSVSGTIDVAGSSATGLVGSVTLATLSFQSTGTLGASSNLGVPSVSFEDRSHTAVSAQASSGTVRLSLQGDANLDRSVTAVDALCILRMTAGLGQTGACPVNANAPAAADVNGDGHVTSVDALCALRIVATLPATGACPTLSGSGAENAALPRAAARVSAASAEQSTAAPAQLAVSLNANAGSRRQATTAEVTAEATNLGAWTIDVSYDPRRLQPVSCAPLNGSVCNVTFGANTVRISGVSVAGLSGHQVLAQVTFQARGRSIAPGALTLTPVVLAGAE